MYRKLLFVLVLLAVAMSAVSVSQGQFITGVERRNPDGNSGDTEPVISDTLLAEDSLCYVDRTHQYNEVPEILLEAEYIRTANDDKDNASYEMDVTLSQDVTLYLILDNRIPSGGGSGQGADPDLAGAGMNWVADLGFEDTGLDIGIDEGGDGDIDRWSSVYAAPVSAGTITLLAQNTNGNMYGVAAVAPRLKARKPSPADGADGVITPLFQWTAGDTALFHRLYLGTSPELTEADLVGPQTTFEMYYHAPGLTPGVTYYWRVDEVEADMATVHTGDVWSFAAAPLAAFAPTPADGAIFVEPNRPELSWTGGTKAVTHEVYFSTDQTAVENGDPAAFQGSSLLLSWTAPALEKGTTYYWRVDEVESDGTTKYAGAVWSFETAPLIPMTDPSLLGWWKMDEGVGTVAADWSGYDRHAQLGDPAPSWAVGQFGGALEFAGNGDSAVYADGSFLNGLEALTVTAWIKSDVTNTDKGFIIFENPAGNDDQDMRYDAAGTTGGGSNLLKLGVTVATDAGDVVVQVESSNDSQTTEWQHVAMTWSSGQPLQLYLNGKPDVPTASSDAEIGTLTGASTVIIGKGGKDTSGSWDGLIDEVRIYSEALTQDDITLVMRGDLSSAWDPIPGNGATVDIVQAAMLSWQPGEKASQHDVYLGADRAAVDAADASDATGIYRGRQNITSYMPVPALEWDRQYFWRVDEINNDGTTTKGFVWSFTLVDFLIVDDFESYTNEVGSRVFQVWIDGLGFSEPVDTPGNGTGAIVGHDIWSADSPYYEGAIVETADVQGGYQAMPLYYDNSTSPYLSEAQRTWTTPQDWTLNGLDTLQVYFKGRPAAFLEAGPGAITLSAEGADIWNAADEFRYAYKALNGNGSIVARVDRLIDPDPWTKAGVMIRQTLDAGSAFAAVYMTGNYGIRYQARERANMNAISDSAVATAEQIAMREPNWVKIERVGNDFNGYYSTDGVTWTAMAWNPQTLNMTGNVYVGLALTSHSAGNPAVAEFSGIQTTGGVSGAWQVAEIGDAPHPSNTAADVYVTLQDSLGRVATVSYPDGATAAEWTQWDISLADFAGINPAAVKKMSIGVGNPSAATPDGAGMILVDEIRIITP